MAETKHEFQIEFENVDLAEAGQLAEDLKDYVLTADASVEASWKRRDQSSMDFGASLVLLLGTPAVIAVAKGLERFLARYQTASIRITGPDGSVVIDNVTSRQASDLAERMLRAFPRSPS